MSADITAQRVRDKVLITANTSHGAYWLRRNVMVSASYHVDDEDAPEVLALMRKDGLEVEEK